MVIYDFDPLKLPQNVLSAIGLVTSCAAQTESIIEDAIHSFLDIDFEYGMAVTTHMTMPQRISALKTTAEIRIDDLDALDELDEIVDKLELAFKKRNDIVHHRWCTEPVSSDVFMVKSTARTTVRMDLLPMTPESIKDDAAFIYDAGMQLMRFLMKNNFSPRAPPADRSRAHKTKQERKKRDK